MILWRLFRSVIYLYVTMNKTMKSQEIFKALLYTNFSQQQCIEQQNNQRHKIIPTKENLKKEINQLQKNKIEFQNLVQHRKQLKQTLKELLNYRQSIDYDHKFKSLKFDHYQFPYRNNSSLKTQLNNQRLQNIQKRKKINQLQQQLKQQQHLLQSNKSRKQNWIISQIAHIPTKKDLVVRQDKYWIDRMQNLKNRYLNQQQEYKRAKIRHDYNLFAERSGCRCAGMRVCPICSDLNIETKKNIYARQALLSPRYRSIYNIK